MTSTPLPSWQDGPARNAILDFLRRISSPDSPDFVPPAERIATFDNDGTLWLEKPHITELVFIHDLFRHDEIQPLLHTAGLRQRIEHWWDSFYDEVIEDCHLLLKEFRQGISTRDYHQWVSDWLQKARHPRFDKAYTDLTYTPMREVLALFQAHEFRTYLVSGGSCYFIRPWCEKAYGIPPEQVIGSTLLTRLNEKAHGLEVEMTPIPTYFDNGPGKVLAIESQIARQPIAAFGNSSGDIPMLRWAGMAPVSLCMLVHHTDEAREYRYSPGEDTLQAASAHQWQVIDMQNDWLRIFD
ncbi:HAD family hydrolase [Bowmanella dokdonensis]|uniref:Haloacid dehalogenase-like hydrolase n=1 Tax=Bowmanella dokdonensis TaxID=751969 RepID=A0A939IR83_9ALTE|nr:HAD family hydrolase [Bowmanella dokdonensis]MBN7825377.1 haloacid dehalogenase-like hydrolase [Bowmanella dokdonensis]